VSGLRFEIISSMSPRLRLSRVIKDLNHGGRLLMIGSRGGECSRDQDCRGIVLEGSVSQNRIRVTLKRIVVGLLCMVDSSSSIATAYEKQVNRLI
jgi:hypothetical protein